MREALDATEVRRRLFEELGAIENAALPLILEAGALGRVVLLAQLAPAVVRLVVEGDEIEASRDLALVKLSELPDGGVRLREALVERYRQFDKAIELSVMIQEVNSYRVSVIGKVAQPQRYILKSPTTILELLAMAGGLTEYADGENITLLRPEAIAPGRTGTGKTFRRIRFNYKKVVSSGGETENFAVQPNDIVIIP